MRFSVLREQKDLNFSSLEHLSVLCQNRLCQFAEQKAKEVGFYYFVQYYLFATIGGSA